MEMKKNILHPLRLQNFAKDCLLEDASNFDFAGAITGKSEYEFIIYMKNTGMLAGVPFADAVFKELGLNAHWLHNDGEWLESICEIAKIKGPPKHLLLAERIVLNILCRASGIATETKKMLNHLAQVKWEGILAATRKTTPGFRMVEKYAALVGGADMHRYDLSNMVMLKDNHITICGSILKAVNDVRKLCGFSQKIEVECKSLQDALDACIAKCDIVMLDNFSPEELKKVAKRVKIEFPNILIETSGGITIENIKLYAHPWVDIISSSQLVQGYSTIDFSMKAIPTQF